MWRGRPRPLTLDFWCFGNGKSARTSRTALDTSHPSPRPWIRCTIPKGFSWATQGAGGVAQLMDSSNDHRSLQQKTARQLIWTSLLMQYSSCKTDNIAPRVTKNLGPSFPPRLLTSVKMFGVV